MQIIDLYESDDEENIASSRQKFGELKRSGMHGNEVRTMRLSRDDGEKGKDRGGEGMKEKLLLSKY